MPRTSIYTDDLAELICSRLEAGRSTGRHLPRRDHGTSRTVLRWAGEKEGFGAACAPGWSAVRSPTISAWPTT